jgi:hypothetical protein
MRSLLAALLILNFSFMIVQCGLDIEDPTPPSPPIWIQKSLPEEWPERGIDAHESGGVFLEWEINPIEEDISMYHIFRAEKIEAIGAIGEFVPLRSFPAPYQNNPEFIDNNIAIGTKYFYKLLAEDISGHKSPFSDTLGYTLMAKVNSGRMDPNGLLEELKNTRQLSWQYVMNIAMENYCLTILSENDALIWRELIQPTVYTDGLETWTLPESAILSSGSNYKWRVDMGAQYVNDRETRGSESEWASFIYIPNSHYY